MVPAGRSRSSVSAASLASISSSAGRSVSISRSPASVGATLRVVRVSRRRPSLASSRRIAWLSADWEMPSFAAALGEALFFGDGEEHGQAAQLFTSQPDLLLNS